jgi:hypothetical protein
MEEVELARQADAACAAVAELLHAGRRDPEGVRVVSVEGESGTGEARLDPLDPGRARPDADGIGAARTFKTAGVRPG